MGVCTGPNNNNSGWVGGVRAVNPPGPGPTPSPPVPPEARMDFNDDAWPLVDVPHDFVIDGTVNASDPASGHSYLPRAVGWYRKHFNLPQEWGGGGEGSNNAIWLYFGGVFRSADFYINGIHVLSHACGYTSIPLRLDNATGIKFGNGTSNTNVLAIYVNALTGSGWWYEGGGIYRHVELISAPALHIDQDGVYAPSKITGKVSPVEESGTSTNTAAAAAAETTTAAAAAQGGLWAESASIDASVDVINSGSESVASGACAVLDLFDANGARVSGTAVKTQTVIGANGGKVQIKASFSLDNAQLWTIRRPYLYTLRTRVSASCNSDPSAAAAAASAAAGDVGDADSATLVVDDMGRKNFIINDDNIFDEVNVTLGVRSLKYTADSGLIMNGEHVKVRGFCDHNNFAVVGMAVPDRVNLFRAQASRSVGGNGRRTSHNPPNPSMLDIYDRVGVVVMDENRQFSNTTAYVENMGQMVRRDRQHASVIIWSFCNEAGCEGTAEQGGPRFKAITEKFAPGTTTLANMFTYNDLLSHSIDVQGFSHRDFGTFVAARKAMPSKPLFASECCSCISQRGEDFTRNNTNVNFNAGCVAGQTNTSNGVPWIVGTMVWTLMDYYGEPAFGGWPHVSSSFGSFDLAGFPKAAVAWYRSNWLYRVPDESSDKPFATGSSAHVAHLVEHWNPPPPPPPPTPSMHQLFGVGCDGTTNQRIKYSGNSSTGGTLINSHGMCATAQGASNETVSFSPCAADANVDAAAAAAGGALVAASQRFILSPQGQLESVAFSGSCLDLWTATGPSVGTWPCFHPAAVNQKWAISTTDSTVHQVNSNVCLSDTNSGTPNGRLRVLNGYTDAPRARLEVNGATVDDAANVYDPATGGQSWASFGSVSYAKGNVTLIAMDSNNRTLASHTRLTAGKVAAIALQIDAPSEVTGTGSAVYADGQDVALIRATLVDAKGTHVNAMENDIRVSFRVVSGPGRVVGTHNGDPTCHENNHAPSHMAYHGLVRAVVMVTVDAASNTDAQRKRVREIDAEGGQGPTRVLAPGQSLRLDDQMIVVEASASGLNPVRISIPVSTDPKDAVLAVAAKSAGKPVVV